MIGANIVRIDGDLLDDALLSSVTVVQELNTHWWCDLECRQTPDKTVPIEDMLGKGLAIVTPAPDGSEITVFEGIIVESERDYEIWGSSAARIRAVTQSYLLDLTPRRAYYPQQSPQDVASKLMSSAGLKWEGSIDGATLSYVQMGETDFSFISRLTDGSEKWLRPTWEGLEAQDSFAKGATLQWRGELGLLRFNVSGKIAPAAFTGAHYDYRNMESVVAANLSDDAASFGSASQMVDSAKSQSANLTAAYVPERDRLLAASELETRLKKESRRSKSNLVLCHGISREQQLKAGDQVTIEGVLDANGTYGIIQVVHHWSQSGYENEFLCTPATKYAGARPQPPKVAGIVPARVVDNNDPEQMARLKIQYFWQEENRTCWARWMTPHAGDDRGILFLPELGDEVWVMFEEGDPERPRIVGCSWNGVHKPPREELWGGDVNPNDVKRVVTKSGHRITISDKDGKDAIVLATPNHLKMSLLESSNETGDAMLALHSDGDIFLSAPNGRIHFHSKYFSREAGGRVEIPSINEQVQQVPAEIQPNPSAKGVSTSKSKEKVKGTAIAIPSDVNSIVCKSGVLVVQNNNATGPDSSCTQAHEESHIKDWKDRYGEDLCKSVPDGSLPVGGDGYAEFLRQSECKAYNAGKGCREKLLKNATDTDKATIQRAIDRDNTQLKAQKCE